MALCVYSAGCISSSSRLERQPQQCGTAHAHRQCTAIRTWLLHAAAWPSEPPISLFRPCQTGCICLPQNDHNLGSSAHTCSRNSEHSWGRSFCCSLQCAELPSHKLDTACTLSASALQHITMLIMTLVQCMSLLAMRCNAMHLSRGAHIQEANAISTTGHTQIANHATKPACVKA